jgi:hypothetical protein
VTYPTFWTFELDERTTHMSLVSTSESSGPIFATPDTVDEVIACLVRTRATPADVAGLLDLAHKLMRTSVVHYEFAGLAAEKSLQALERALRLRLSAGDKPTFKKLIDLAVAQSLLSRGDAELMNDGRGLRNFLAHPSTAPALPLVTATGILRTSFRLIGSLFPDEVSRSN